MKKNNDYLGLPIVFLLVAGMSWFTKFFLSHITFGVNVFSLIFHLLILAEIVIASSLFFKALKKSGKTQKSAILSSVCLCAIPAFAIAMIVFGYGRIVSLKTFAVCVVAILAAGYIFAKLSDYIRWQRICSAVVVGILVFVIGFWITPDSSSNNLKKVECGICHGSGIQPNYEYDCLFCDGKGYVPVESKGDAKNICSSCKKTVDKLITKEDVGGDVITWCSDCWDNYYDIIN